MILHKSLNHAAKHTKKIITEEIGRISLEVFEVLKENTSIH